MKAIQPDIIPTMKRSRKPPSSERRHRLAESVGRAISRLQDASYEFDGVAADILAAPRGDLPCMTMLLFAGPKSADELATVLQLPRGHVVTTLERLQLAGYARFQPGDTSRIEMTGHARKWVERIWGPCGRMDSGFSTPTRLGI
jgi:hypothetical protein